MLNVMGLCSGIGGAEIALSEWGKPVCFVEFAPYPQEVLKLRYPGIPIFSDLRKFDGKPWRRCVDLITAGFPCQDLSLAGNRDGLDGERSGLFFDVARVVREVRPHFVFLENVPGIRRFLGTVEGEMADAGYECRWDVVSAAEVGAWHLRKRWFCLAADIDRIRGRVQQGRRGGQKRQGAAYTGHDGSKGAVAHSHGIGRVQVVAESKGQQGKHDDIGAGQARRFADDADRQGQLQPSRFVTDVGGRPNNCFAPEWWATEPNVGRVVHGLSTRLDKRIRAERIKALGNSLVPAQGKEAFKRLIGLPCP